MRTQDIGWAVEQLKAGRKVCRRGWNGKGQWLAVQDMSHTPGDWASYVVISTVEHDLVPWTCSQTDLLAEDWEIA